MLQICANLFLLIANLGKTSCNQNAFYGVGFLGALASFVEVSLQKHLGFLFVIIVNNRPISRA